MSATELRVKELFFSQVGAAESLDLTLESDAFPEFNLSAPVECKGRLVRVKEGIAMEIEELKSSIQVPCVRCGKSLTWPLQTKGGEEWFFWEKRFAPEESLEELLFVTMKNWSIDVHEPIRQELDLTLPLAPHCAQNCGDWPESQGPESAETKPFKNLLLQFKQ